MSQYFQKGREFCHTFYHRRDGALLVLQKEWEKEEKKPPALGEKWTCKPVFDLSMYRKMVVCIVWPLLLQGPIAFSFFFTSLRTGVVKGKTAPSPSLEIFLHARDIIDTSFFATYYCLNTRREHCYSRRWGLTPRSGAP